MRLYRAKRYGQALSDCDAVVSVGSKGASYDVVLAEALNSLYKAELILGRPLPRRPRALQGVDDVEFATADWAHWFNNTRPPLRHRHARSDRP